MDFKEGLRRTIDWFAQQGAGSTGSIMDTGIVGAARQGGWMIVVNTFLVMERELRWG